MFERFLFRATDLPESPEVRFFDEKITEKQNRSLAFGTPNPTPFLDDKSCRQLSQSVAAPVPHGRGLPLQWWQQHGPWRREQASESSSSNNPSELIGMSLLFPARLNVNLIHTPLIRPTLPTLPPPPLPSIAAHLASAPSTANGSDRRTQSVASFGGSDRGEAASTLRSHLPACSISTAGKLNRSMTVMHNIITTFKRIERCQWYIKIRYEDLSSFIFYLSFDALIYVAVLPSGPLFFDFVVVSRAFS